MGVLSRCQDGPAGGSAVFFDLATAQSRLLSSGKIDGVVVRAAAGVDQVELSRRVAAVLPADVEAVSGATIIAETQDVFQQRISAFTKFLSSFAFVAVMVGSFVIYNTFTIVVAQRARELGLLRAIGAGHAQVLRMVMGEALVVGLVASAAGLVGGVGIGSLLRGFFRRAGLRFPSGGLVVAPRTAIIGMVVGRGLQCSPPASRRYGPLVLHRWRPCARAPSTARVRRWYGVLPAVSGWC